MSATWIKWNFVESQYILFRKPESSWEGKRVPRDYFLFATSQINLMPPQHKPTKLSPTQPTNQPSHTFVPPSHPVPSLPLGSEIEREDSWLVELSALSPLLIGWRINNQIKKLSASEKDQLMSLASSPRKHVLLSIHVSLCDFIHTKNSLCL